MVLAIDTMKVLNCYKHSWFIGPLWLTPKSEGDGQWIVRCPLDWPSEPAVVSETTLTYSDQQLANVENE